MEKKEKNTLLCKGSAKVCYRLYFNQLTKKHFCRFNDIELGKEQIKRNNRLKHNITTLFFRQSNCVNTYRQKKY